MTTSMQDVMQQYTDIQGILSVDFRDREGKTVYSDCGPNMIMTVTKATLAHLIGGDTTGKSITQLALGNDTTEPSPDNYTIGGIPSTDLTSGINVVSGVTCAYLKTLTGHTYPAEGRISFDWGLDYGEANGLEITEYGLVCEDLTLFSRKTRGIVTKSSGLSATGTWTIIF